MKIIVIAVACCLLCATAAFGQVANVLSSQPQVYQVPSHPGRADQKSMASLENLLGQTAYSSAHGERPLWEVAPKPAPVTPLGDTARQVRKERAEAKKAIRVWEN